MELEKKAESMMKQNSLTPEDEVHRHIWWRATVTGVKLENRYSKAVADVSGRDWKTS
jgi:hypothetical protein